MKVSRTLLALNAVCLAAIAWLYGGDLVDYVRAKSAPAAALTELPKPRFAGPIVALALAASGVVVFGLLKRRDNTFRGYRLLPILLVVAIFADAFVLSEARLPISSADQSAITLHLLARTLSGMAKDQAVPTDATAIEEVVKALGPPPFLDHGRRPERFAVQVREKCDGPIDTAPGARVGTVLYCVSGDRRTAWLTLMGLPAEKRFGDPEVFSRGGVVQVTTVSPPEETEATEKRPGEEQLRPAPGSPDSATSPEGERTLTPPQAGR